MAHITSVCGLRWPLAIGAHGTEPIHAVRTLAGDQPFSVEVARIDDRRGGQPPLTFEGRMDVGGGRTIAEGPVVVSTGIRRWGTASSQVSVTWTFYPTHDVVCFWPYRASTSEGELINSPDGGIPSFAVRQPTGPDSR
jgi:hypothetical protein